MNFLEKFNEIFLDMLNDLINVFPDDPYFKIYQVAVKGGLLVNEQIVCKIFKDHVMDQFGETILEKNESFFLETDFSEFNKKTNKVDVRQIIYHLKGHWFELTTENKETLWKYFKILLLLTQKVYP